MIGLETHVQLDTESKVFCSYKNSTNLTEEHESNIYVYNACLGML